MSLISDNNFSVKMKPRMGYYHTKTKSNDSSISPSRLKLSKNLLEPSQDFGNVIIDSQFATNENQQSHKIPVRQVADKNKQRTRKNNLSQPVSTELESKISPAGQIEASDHGLKLADDQQTLHTRGSGSLSDLQSHAAIRVDVSKSPKHRPQR